MKWMFVEGEGKYRTCICFWFQTIYKSPHMQWTGMLRENSNHDFLSGAVCAFFPLPSIFFMSMRNIMACEWEDKQWKNSSDSLKIAV